MNASTPGPANLLLAIVISAALGAAVGLIRQWTDWEEENRDIDSGGARTYSLRAVLGCLSAGVADRSPSLLGVLVVAITAHELFATTRMARRRAGRTSFTAVLLTILTGALVGWGELVAAIVVASVTAITLAVKGPVHAWTERFTRDDVRVTLQFVAVTGVILPLVPNRTFGPGDAFNPYATWLMVVFISAIGFAGYVAMRWLGPRAGILWTSLLGGIASSTATALAFSRRSGQDPQLSVSCSLGVVIASLLMFVRVIAIVAVFSPVLACAVAERFAIMAAPAVIATMVLLVLQHRQKHDVGIPALRNPLSLGTALKFGALYAVVTLLVKIVRTHWQAGLLPLSFFSALTNMDAITLSLAHGALAIRTAAAALVVAAVANTLVKIGLALALGSAVARVAVGISLGLTATAGVAVVVWL